MNIRQWQARTLRMIVKIWPSILDDEDYEGAFSLQDGIREVAAYLEASESQVGQWIRGQGEIDQFQIDIITELRHVFYARHNYKKIYQPARDLARYIIKEADENNLQISLLNAIYLLLKTERDITDIQEANQSWPHRKAEGPSISGENGTLRMYHLIGVRRVLIEALGLDESNDVWYFTYYR